MAKKTGTILKSVGRNGENQYPDVVVVQLLLKDTLRIYLKDLPGMVGESTIAAIEAFQKNVVGMTKPDGVIDPGGSTIKALAFSQLPTSGNGYYTYGTEPAKLWGAPETIDSLTRLAHRVKAKLGVEVGISDISYRNGRKMTPHTSHRQGLNVDMRPLRTDGLHKPVTIASAKYSQERTKILVELIRKDENATKILFNDTNIDGVTWYANHDNHLHITYGTSAHPLGKIAHSIDSVVTRVLRGFNELTGSAK